MVVREEDKIRKEIPNTEITTPGSDITIYKRTSGRKFILEEVTIHNKSGASAVVEIWDGASTDGRKKLDMELADGETNQFDNLHREFEFGDVVVQVDGQPVSISGSGSEE